MKEKNQKMDFLFSLWLTLIFILISLIIIVGGITRLTDSGLSITTWELFTGIVPPFSIDEWNKYFNLYKSIPEYQLENSTMTIEGFKTIFWWEYTHRLLGRIIGIFYIIPLIYFSFKIKFKKLFFLYLIFLLICFQGFIGWYMVSSGLTERTDVSQYRLALHLGIAFLILIFILWNLLNTKNIKIDYNKIPIFLPSILLSLIFIQIIIGAFVSGMDGGKIYNSWPSMNGSFFPNDSSLNNFFSLNVFDSPSLMQFIHRNLAYLIMIIFSIIFYIVFSNQKYYLYKNNLLQIMFFLILQIFLGVLTILSGAKIAVAILHQIGSIFLISSTLILVYKNVKKTNLQP